MTSEPERRPGGRLLLACGGSAGHVLPGVTVARRWLQHDGHDVLFAGGRPLPEAALLDRLGLRAETTDATGLRYGVREDGGLRLLAGIARLPRALGQALRIVARYRPDVALCTGGAAAGPVSLAALAFGCPVVVFEPNAAPGLTSRVVGNYAVSVALGRPGAARFFPAGRCRVTGVPVRRSVWHMRREAAEGPLRLLLLGGSLGSPVMDSALARAAPLLVGVEVLHQTGRGDPRPLLRRYGAAGLEARVVRHIDDMASAYAWADLAVSRAGAMTCAELAVAGVPALLVPDPAAADDHQTLNAADLVRAGLAWAWPESELRPGRLADLVNELAEDRSVLESRRGRREGFSTPECAASIVDMLHDAVRNPPPLRLRLACAGFWAAGCPPAQTLPRPPHR